MKEDQEDIDVGNQKLKKNGRGGNKYFNIDKRGKKAKAEIPPERRAVKTKSDTLIYADALTTKTTGTHEIYPRSQALEKSDIDTISP